MSADSRLADRLRAATRELLNADNPSHTLRPDVLDGVSVFREAGWLPMLFTDIRTFGEHSLNGYDCGLTVPRALPGDWPMLDRGGLAFSYRLGAMPGLVCRAAQPLR